MLLNNLVNAEVMSILHPETFERVDQEKIDNLKPGDNVKICHNKERFWCIVLEVNGQWVKAEVNNDVSLEQPFKLGDILDFNKQNIYDVLVKDTRFEDLMIESITDQPHIALNIDTGIGKVHEECFKCLKTKK